MATIFYPSCKVQADFPTESAAVRRYLTEREVSAQL